MDLIYVQRISSVLNLCKEKLEFRNKSINSDRFLLKSQGNLVHDLKCILAINGDTIFDADIKLNKSTHTIYKTSIKEEFGDGYKLHQIQDCLNFVTNAFDLIYMENNSGNSRISCLDYDFIMEVFIFLRNAKDVLTNPRRKSIEEHIKNPKRKCFHPPIPQDLALSIFIRDSKLILAAYLLEINQNKRHELIGRITVDCDIPWLAEVLDLLNYAITTALFLLNKSKR